MDILVNVYVFKANSTFYTVDPMFLRFESSTTIMDKVKDYFVNEFNKYKGMHLVIIPEDSDGEINRDLSDAYPILVLNEDRKYGM